MTRRHIPEDLNLHQNRHENLKFRKRLTSTGHPTSCTMGTGSTFTTVTAAGTSRVKRTSTPPHVLLIARSRRCHDVTELTRVTHSHSYCAHLLPTGALTSWHRGHRLSYAPPATDTSALFCRVYRKQSTVLHTAVIHVRDKRPELWIFCLLHMNLLVLVLLDCYLSLLLLILKIVVHLKTTAVCF